MVDKLLLFISILGLNVSCDEEVNTLEGVKANNDKVPTEVFNLVSECIVHGCHWRFEKNIDHPTNIRIAKSYYSPDKKRCFFIVLSQVNGIVNRKNPDIDFEISADPFVAFIEEGKWKVYHYGWNTASGYMDYKFVESEMIKWAEGENFRKKVYVFTYNNGKRESEPVGISPNNIGFWDSKLWQKGLEIEGVYPFEIERFNSGTEEVPSINELVNECY